MSVRLRKLEGVESVDLRLNDGRATLELAAKNMVTVEQVYTTVRQAGFTPRAAHVTAVAQVMIDKDEPVIRITGTGESFAATASKPVTRHDLEKHAGATVLIEGLIDPPEDGTKPRIAITSIGRARGARPAHAR